MSTAPEAHSKFSASAAERWMSCPGSIQLSKGKPDKVSQYAAEGTVAHQVAAWCLTEGKDAVAYIGRVIEADGFTFTVDEDMAGHVQVYVDQVREYGTEAGALMVERRVNYADHLGVDECDGFGTSDAIIVHPARRLLSVHDLKFGRGDEVEAQDNKQMRLYALGALTELEAIGFERSDFDRVLMVIHQPRVSTKPKEWEIPLSELLAFAGEARTAAENVIDAMLEYPSVDWHEKFTQATEKGCKYCRAKAGCATLRAAVTETVMGGAPATPEEFEALGVEKPAETVKAVNVLAGTDGSEWIAAALSKVDLIEDWCKAIRAEAEERLLAGAAVPGYKLVNGKKGNRAWKDAAAAEAQLKTFRLKVEEMYDLKLISPTAAEKLAKAGSIGKRQWPKLQDLIHQPDGKLHVAPESDPREAVQVKPVEDEFEPQEAQAPATVDDLA